MTIDAHQLDRISGFAGECLLSPSGDAPGGSLFQGDHSWAHQQSQANYAQKQKSIRDLRPECFPWWPL